MQTKQIHIADTIHSAILLSTYEKEVISTQLFNRLHHISQNSTAYLTYPANKTTRFEHSMGTMKLCGDILFGSFVNASGDEVGGFLTEFERALGEYVVDGVILKEGSTDKFRPILGDANITREKLRSFGGITVSNVFYNQCVPMNVPDGLRAAYLILFQAVRLCGLLHDIGHPPFSHISEYALGNLYREIKAKPESERTARETDFFSILSEYELPGQSFELHEKISGKMTERMISDLLYGDLGWTSALSFDDKYFKILVFEAVKCVFAEKGELFKTIHSIISGPVDGDRLDYVVRDSVNSGFRSRGASYERLLSSMRLARVGDEYFFAFDIKTISHVEDFYLSRWNLYKYVLFHHRVVKTDSLLQSCIENIIQRYLSEPGEPGRSGSRVLPHDISGLWKALEIVHSNKGYFNALIQWDDAWLMTVLKKHFFSDYYDRAGDPTALKLEELLSNKKNYYSLIKNDADFRLCGDGFDRRFAALAETEWNVSQAHAEILSDCNTGMLYKADEYIRQNLEGRLDFPELIKKNIRSYIEERFGNMGLSWLAEYKPIKNGLSREPYVFLAGGVKSLTEVSNIRQVLDQERFSRPFFHVYLHFSEKVDALPAFQKQFLSGLGEYLAEKVFQALGDE